ANTLSAYRRDLRAYHEWLVERSQPLSEVRASDIATYIAHLRAQHRAPSSVARATVAVRSLHHFLADEGLSAVDAATAVEAPKVPAGLPKALAEDGVAELVDVAVGD